MFDLGFFELVVIGVVALIFIGPKELPVLMRQFGRWVRKIRLMMSQWQSNIEKWVDEDLKDSEKPDHPDSQKHPLDVTQDLPAPTFARNHADPPIRADKKNQTKTKVRS